MRDQDPLTKEFGPEDAARAERALTGGFEITVHYDCRFFHIYTAERGIPSRRRRWGPNIGLGPIRGKTLEINDRGNTYSVEVT